MTRCLRQSGRASMERFAGCPEAGRSAGSRNASRRPRGTRRLPSIVPGDHLVLLVEEELDGDDLDAGVGVEWQDRARRRPSGARARRACAGSEQPRPVQPRSCPPSAMRRRGCCGRHCPCRSRCRSRSCTGRRAPSEAVLTPAEALRERLLLVWGQQEAGSRGPRSRAGWRRSPSPPSRSGEANRQWGGQRDVHPSLLRHLDSHPGTRCPCEARGR